MSYENDREKYLLKQSHVALLWARNRVQQLVYRMEKDGYHKVLTDDDWMWLEAIDLVLPDLSRYSKTKGEVGELPRGNNKT